MRDVHSLLGVGKIIKLINANDDAWELGVSKLLESGAIVCDLLDSAEVLPKKEDKDLKLAISFGSGICLVPAHIERISEDGIRYKFSLAENYEFVQRREYFRLQDPEIDINCEIHGEPCNVKALDLSGGGIGLLVERKAPVKKDTLLKLEITLPDGKTIRVSARAAHVVPAEEPNKSFVGARFPNIKAADESKIIKYIFSEQIRRAKRYDEPDFTTRQAV